MTRHMTLPCWNSAFSRYVSYHQHANVFKIICFVDRGTVAEGTEVAVKSHGLLKHPISLMKRVCWVSAFLGTKHHIWKSYMFLLIK